MTNPRTRARIQARIHERVAYCIEFELNDPRSTFITVTRVEISPDLSIAKVYYSVLGGKSERSRAQHMLADASGFIRKQVGRVLRMRRIPQLTWFFDDTIELQEDMERRIAEALVRDRDVNPTAHADQPVPAPPAGEESTSVPEPGSEDEADDDEPPSA